MSESPSTFVEEEKVSASGNAFRSYLRLMSDLKLLHWLFPLCFVLIVLASLAPSFFRWYAGLLTQGRQHDWIPISILGIVCLALLAAITRILAWATFELSGMWATLGIHRKMVSALAKTRTTFFDENPSGRLINRLVRDFEEVRFSAVIFTGDVLNGIVEVLSVGILILMASPIAVILFLPLFAAFFILHVLRSEVVEKARTFVSISTGQLLHRQTDLVDGRDVFRIYGKIPSVLQRMQTSIESVIRAKAFANLLETQFSFLIRIATELVVLMMTIGVVLAYQANKIDAPFVGVLISALLGLRGSINWLDFAAGQVSSSIANVKRIYEIADLPPEESEEFIKPTSVARNTLDRKEGKIVFQDLTVSYRKDSPIILEGFNLEIQPKQKVALLGRTGSGKSSVFQALFRMMYVHRGEILFAGQSLHQQSISQVRNLFSVVPQFPYLFEGTIRSNLDPQNRHKDSWLQECLEISGLTFQLELPVQETGSNFSLGERQLICLARTLIDKRPILLLDEPTSSLDPVTDARMTKVLSEQFRDHTVIAIAHREQTIMNYDRKVHLQGGKIISVH